MCEEAERLKAKIDGYDDDIGGLINPMIEGTCTYIAKDVCCWEARSQIGIGNTRGHRDRLHTSTVDEEQYGH